MSTPVTEFRSRCHRRLRRGGRVVFNPAGFEEDAQKLQAARILSVGVFCVVSELSQGRSVRARRNCTRPACCCLSASEEAPILRLLISDSLEMALPTPRWEAWINMRKPPVPI